MRRLVLLALVALAAFPLSARNRWHGPRRVVVVEAPRCAPYRYWNEHRWDDRWERRWENRWERRAWHQHHDCDDDDDDRIIVRPLPRPIRPPFEGRLELRIR